MSTITGKRNYNYGVTVRLSVQECCECGLVFGVATDFDTRRRADQKGFYCPAGHFQSYCGPTEAQQQRERAEAAERRAEMAEATARRQRERAEALDRSRSAYKGQLTKIRNRIAAGVCPVPGCKRTGLTQTMRHIATKHPHWHDEHAKDLA